LDYQETDAVPPALPLHFLLRVSLPYAFSPAPTRTRRPQGPVDRRRRLFVRPPWQRPLSLDAPFQRPLPSPFREHLRSISRTPAFSTLPKGNGPLRAAGARGRYERTALLAWFEKRGAKSPRTGRRIPDTRIVPNNALRGLIAQLQGDGAGQEAAGS